MSSGVPRKKKAVKQAFSVIKQGDCLYEALQNGTLTQEQNDAIFLSAQHSVWLYSPNPANMPGKFFSSYCGKLGTYSNGKPSGIPYYHGEFTDMMTTDDIASNNMIRVLDTVVNGKQGDLKKIRERVVQSAMIGWTVAGTGTCNGLPPTASYGAACSGATVATFSKDWYKCAQKLSKSPNYYVGAAAEGTYWSSGSANACCTGTLSPVSVMTAAAWPPYGAVYTPNGPHAPYIGCINKFCGGTASFLIPSAITGNSVLSGYYSGSIYPNWACSGTQYYATQSLFVRVLGSLGPYDRLDIYYGGANGMSHLGASLVGAAASPNWKHPTQNYGRDHIEIPTASLGAGCQIVFTSSAAWGGDEVPRIGAQVFYKMIDAS